MPDEAVLETETEELEQPALEQTADDLPAEHNESQELDTSADVTTGGGEGAEVDTGIDGELASLASAYGYDMAADPKGTGLARFLVRTLHNELASFGERSINPQPEPEQRSAKDLPVPKSALDWEKLIPDVGLPESDFDPALRAAIAAGPKSVREAFKAMQGEFAQQIAAARQEIESAYKERLDGLESYQQKQEEARFTSQLDDFFDKQGADWTGEYGKGPGASLPPHSPLLANRNKVIKFAVNMQAGYIARKQNPPEFVQLLKWAQDAVYADKHATTARNQVTKQLSQRTGAALARGNGKQPKPADAETRARRVIQEKLKQYGFSDTGDDE